MALKPETTIPAYAIRISILSMLVVTVALIGGGVRLESFLLPPLAIGFLAGFTRFTDTERFEHELRTFLLVLTILTILYLWIGWDGRFENFIGDGRVWLKGAQVIIRDGYFSTPVENIMEHVTHVGVPYLYAAVLIVGNENIYALIILHALVIVLTANIMYKIGERVLDVRTARLAYWMIALHPEILAWSSILIRESLIVFLIAGFFYACIRFFVDGSRWHGLFLLTNLGATYFVRTSMVFAFLAIAFVCAALVMVKPHRYLIAAVAFGAMVAIGIGLTMVHYSGDPRVPGIGTMLVGGIVAKSTAGTMEFGEISIIRDFLGGKFTVMNFYLWPLWVIAYWVYPFPQLLAGIHYVNPMVIIVENFMGVINLMLLPFIVLGVLAIIQDSRINRLMLVAATAIMATGANFAGPFVLGRYRLVVTPFFILIAAYALTHMRMSQRVLVAALIPFTMVTFYVSYLLVKVLLS